MAQLEMNHPFTAQIWDWPLQHHDGIAPLHNDQKGFEVSLELQDFAPKEIKVQVIGRNVVIDCEHSDKQGSIKREVHRSYVLPDDVDAKSLKSHLTDKGLLSITANK